MAIPQQLFFSGVVRGESAMRSERDVGSKVKYEVTVSVLVCSPSWSPSLPGTEKRLRQALRVGALLLYGEFEASPCSWTLAVGRCLCRGLS